jgi:hypothetical protein
MHDIVDTVRSQAMRNHHTRRTAAAVRPNTAAPAIATAVSRIVNVLEAWTP